MRICPNCNSDLLFAFKLKYNILKCKSCQLLIAEDAVFSFAKELTLNENAREEALKQIRIKNFVKSLEFIETHFPNKEVLGLEVGCGYGWFLDLCKSHKVNCVGIEPETRFTNMYKENGHIVLNGFYPDDIDLKNKFDFIIFNDVLEHIPNINRVICSVYDQLLPSGLMIVNIPVQSGLFYLGSVVLYHLGLKSFLNRMWQFNFTSPHLYYFTRKNLIELAQQSGFELVHINTSITLDPFQIRNRILQDTQINKFKLNIITLLAFIAFPFTRLMPDTLCFFFKKVSS